jgi:hypothetical protein
MRLCRSCWCGSARRSLAAGEIATGRPLSWPSAEAGERRGPAGLARLVGPSKGEVGQGERGREGHAPRCRLGWLGQRERGVGRAGEMDFFSIFFFSKISNSVDFVYFIMN